MTIETRKAANVNEALEILNSLLPNGTFVYDTENYSNDYKTTYRHFDATAQNGATCYGMIEFVENGNLVKARFINIYRETAVDIEIENFTAGVATVDNNELDENHVDDADNGEDKITVELNPKMAITTKEGANGRISAYYINGVKVRKAEVEYHACNPAYDGIIVVDYFTARHQFPNLYLYGSAVVFKNWVDGSDVMTKAAADRLGLKLGKKISLYPAIFRVVKNEVPDVEPNPVDYAITAAAQDVASDAEIQLANNELDENNVDDIDTTNSESTGYIFTKVLARKGFDEGGYYSRLEEISSSCQILGDKNNFDNSVYREVVFFDEELCQSWELKSADGTLLAKGTSRNDALKIFANTSKIDSTTNYQHQTNWVNPHDFTTTGDLSGRNLYGRFIAANVALEQEQELRELKADGVQFLLKVNVPKMHRYSNFYFETVINTYKSLDALKKYGGKAIREHNWRIETIDGELIAKGNGSDEFKSFFDAKEELSLTDNQQDDFNAKLRGLQAKAADAKANLAVKQAALDKAQEDFLQADAALEDANREIIQLGDDKAAELQTLLPNNFEIAFDFINHNFIVSTLNGNSREYFDTYDTPEQVKDAIDFGQHLLALQKEHEDAYPEEVKVLNRDLAQSNLTAPNMHLHIYNNDFHIGSFCGVELSKLHVKSFVTDKIHFNVCYASEPLEHYDTFEEVTAAVNQFKDAISRGDKEFTFPTADKLNLPSDKQINDSLIRAMETNLLNIQAICLTKPTNLTAINREWELYNLCNKALLRKEVA